MTLVVDASVWAAVVTEEADSAAAEAATTGTTLIAPDLLLAEMANLLWKKTRRGLITEADARAAMRGTRQAIDLFVPLDPLASIALRLSLARNHPAYDCFYVALAQREGAPLVTADTKLARIFGEDAEIRLLYPSASA